MAFGSDPLHVLMGTTVLGILHGLLGLFLFWSETDDTSWWDNIFIWIEAFLMFRLAILSLVDMMVAFAYDHGKRISTVDSYRTAQKVASIFLFIFYGPFLFSMICRCDED
jgi:hypothetical protein